MKVRRLMSFALSVFLTLVPINPNVAFAGAGSQGERIFVKEVTERSFKTLAEQGFPMYVSSDAEVEGRLPSSQDAQDKGELLAFLDAEDEGKFPPSLATEDKGELSTSTSLEAEDNGELSTSTSLEAEDKGELSTSTSLEAETNEELSSLTSTAMEDEEFSKADPEDMLAEAPTVYPVKVGYRTVNSVNKDDVLSDGGSVKYEPASRDKRAKITLNNLNYTEYVYPHTGDSVKTSFIKADEYIDLVLKGSNVINLELFEGYRSSDMIAMSGIEVRKLYCSGDAGAVLSINIDASKPTDNLGSLICILTKDEAVFDNVNINMNIKGKSKYAGGINKSLGDQLIIIRNSNINITTSVGYNDKLGSLGYFDGSIYAISGEGCSIESSQLVLNAHSEGGYVKDRVDVAGIINLLDSLYISGNSNVLIKSDKDAIEVADNVNIKDNYNIDLTGRVKFDRGSDSAINFNNVGPNSSFIVRHNSPVLFCSEYEEEGKVDFTAPDEAAVLSGNDEGSLNLVDKAYWKKLFYYKSNPTAYPGFKVLKVTYKNKAGFNSNGGLGSMADVLVPHNEKYTLPNCIFTPPSGKRFKA